MAAFPVLCDIDGVIWLDHEPIPGSVDAIGELRRRGHRVLFVTNNSAARIEDHEAALDSIGIPARGDVLTSAQAGASLVAADERVLVGGGPGVAQAIAERAATPVEWDDPSLADGVDAVIVGLNRAFDYGRLSAMSMAIRAGARFIATNDDATYPTPRGQAPGGGALVAAVATASGQTPVVAGKPNRPMAELAAARLGCAVADLADALMVGDRWSTDGAFADALGCRFGLVRSGVTGPGQRGETIPAFDNADLAALVEDLSR